MTCLSSGTVFVRSFETIPEADANFLCPLAILAQLYGNHLCGYPCYSYYFYAFQAMQMPSASLYNSGRTPQIATAL